MSVEDNKQSITVRIGNKTLTLRINPQNEEYVRAGAKDVDEKIAKFKDKNPKLDITDILSFIAVEYASNYHKEKRSQDESTVQYSFEKINDSLDEILDILK